MKRSLIIALVAVAAVVGRPALAFADITFFVGTSPKPEARTLRGVAAGISMLIVGFEFDYWEIKEDVLGERPGMKSGSFNFLVQTPTNTSLYVTVGGGIYRETLLGDSVTNVGTNFGGGVKIQFFGPFRVRADYRVYALRGNPRNNKPQRLYVGINWLF